MKTLFLFLLGSAVGICGELNLVNMTGSAQSFYFRVSDFGTVPDALDLVVLPSGASIHLTHGNANFWVSSIDLYDPGDVYGTSSGAGMTKEEDYNVIAPYGTGFPQIIYKFYSSPDSPPPAPTLWDWPTEWSGNTTWEVPVIGTVTVPDWIYNSATESFMLGFATAAGVILFRAGLRWFKRADGTQGEV